MECLGLCLRTADEPVESLSLRVGGQINTGDIVVGVCKRPPDQDKADETFRQLEEASQIPALIADSSNPNICWRNTTAGLKQAR